LLGVRAMKRMAFVPFWAWQFVIGAVVVLLAITIASTLIGAAMRVPSAFLDDVGKAVSRIAPQPGSDIEKEDQLKKVIAAMPNGRLRVATVDAEHDRVVFTVTVDRSAVHAAVQPGDELRLSKDGAMEIAPTGVPALMEQLGKAMDELKKKWFGQ
jgi:hypothetical protein